MSVDISWERRASETQNKAPSLRQLSPDPQKSSHEQKGWVSRFGQGS